MIILDQLMLYVYNQTECAKFWQDNFEFKQLERVEQGNGFALVLQDQRENSTKLVLQNKKIMEDMNSGINLDTPSILLKADDIEKLYQKLKNNNITVGELTKFPNTDKRLFNFSDLENNYFAVIEK